MNKELKLLLLIVEAHDIFNRKHSEKVSKLSVRIGKKMNLTPDELKIIEHGALLHDVGKLLLPHDVLNKPGKINEDEKKIIQGHTIIGANLLGEVGYDKRIIEIVKYHHEWWNGQGYPEMLVENQIPPLVRIVSVADAFNVMTSRTIYSPAKSAHKAMAEVEKYKGTQFAPDVVEYLKQVIEQDKTMTNIG